jgi:hypothetical protein
MENLMSRFVVVAFAAFWVTASPAQAWNSIGHMIVAKLAYDRLDAKHQLALFNLLKSHPHYEAFLAAGRPKNVDSEVEWVVLRSATWPDWVRPRKKDTRDVTKFHRGEEHYINIPFIDPKDEKLFAGKTLVDPDLPNIVTALKQRANDLKTKTAAGADRAVAVCWLFHLVGDIHQPLHNVTYFSSDDAFFRGDLGGNKFGIRANGKKWKLHAFWDELLGDDVNYTDDSSAYQANLYRSAVKLADQLRGTDLSEEDQIKLKKNVTFESWSREGYELAMTVGYRKSDGSLLKAVEVPFNGSIPDAAEEVGKEYIATARATAERQVVLAGRRLAERVKILLKGK